MRNVNEELRSAASPAVTGTIPTRRYSAGLGRVALVIVLGVTIAPAGLWAQSAPPSDSTSLETNGNTQTAQAVVVPQRDVDVSRGETVTSRPRPELDALGVRAGSFLVFPSLTLQESFNDNIFAVDNGEDSDFITEIKPEVSIESDWNNHELNVNAGANIGRYLDNNDENFEDLDFGASGRVDVRRSTNVKARARYRMLHEERSSPDDVSGSEPTEYDQLSAGLEGFHNFGRVNLTLGGTFDRFDFDDVSTSVGRINNDDRDRDHVEGSVRVGYEIQPQYEAFVRGSYNVRRYDDSRDDGGFNRDSDGFGVVAGVEIDFGGIVFGEFFAGYRSQDFDDGSLDTVDGPTVGAEITWNVTPLTTIVGSVDRAIVETTSGRASGRFLTTGRLSADHELMRSLLLGADVSATHDDFEGIDRTDLIYEAGVNATYMMNRYLHLFAEYDFRMRDADASTNDYTENQVLVGLRVQY